VLSRPWRPGQKRKPKVFVRQKKPQKVHAYDNDKKLEKERKKVRRINTNSNLSP